MTLRTLAACLAFPFAASAFAAGDGHDHAHTHKPLHGGVVVEASDMDFELVAQAGLLTLHVRDHGKPASVKGATGKITWLSGSDKAEAALAPVGDDTLQAQGAFKPAPGAKVVATVQLAGRKGVHLRFVLP